MSPRGASLILGAALVLASCGGRPKHPRQPPLLEGSGVYTLRHNPTRCLADRPTLHAEVQGPQGWERVALEDVDEEADAVARLMARWVETPDATQVIAGKLGVDTRTYSGNHVARVLRVVELDPPAEDE